MLVEYPSDSFEHPSDGLYARDEDKREEWAASIWQWQKIRRREREERR
jgi:hypothetical protein